MKLYGNPRSPFVRKVRVTIAELGLAGRVAEVETDPRDPAGGLWEKNPLAKLPTFELDDGTILFDSPVICAWLDQTHGGGRLSGAGAGCWRVQTLAALADGVLDAGVLARQETMRQAAEQSAAWIDKQLAIARRGLDHLEARADALADGDAETVDLAAIGTACAVAWLGFRHADIDWLAGRPRLAAWYVGFARRPSMAATAPR